MQEASQDVFPVYTVSVDQQNLEAFEEGVRDLACYESNNNQVSFRKATNKFSRHINSKNKLKTAVEELRLGDEAVERDRLTSFTAPINFKTQKAKDELFKNHNNAKLKVQSCRVQVLQTRHELLLSLVEDLNIVDDKVDDFLTKYADIRPIKDLALAAEAAFRKEQAAGEISLERAEFSRSLKKVHAARVFESHRALDAARKSSLKVAAEPLCAGHPILLLRPPAMVTPINNPENLKPEPWRLTALTLHAKIHLCSFNPNSSTFSNRLTLLTLSTQTPSSTTSRTTLPPLLPTPRRTPLPQSPQAPPPPREPKTSSTAAAGKGSSASVDVTPTLLGVPQLHLVISVSFLTSNLHLHFDSLLTRSPVATFKLNEMKFKRRSTIAPGYFRFVFDF
jgi:hypothetical protein